MNKLVRNILLGFFLVSAGTSCEDYLDVNKDPNNPTEVTPELVLPYGQTFTAYYMNGDRRVNHLGNMLMYNWSESYGFSWYDTEFRYDVTTTFYSSLFDQAYTMPMKQYQALTQYEDPKYAYYVAIGNIMNAYHFQLLVDFYGDVPYSEALGRSLATTPAYDDAATIYADLLVKLTEAINTIKTADELTVAEVENDVMFGGDMDQWIRFANTLKVRILARSYEANPTAAATELAAIATEGSGFISDDVVVDPGYLNQENKQNPYWEAFGFGVTGSMTLTGRATCATQYMLDRLASTGDNRLDRLYEEPGTGHLGVDQGLEPDLNYAFELVSNIGPGLLKSATMGSTIFTLAEHNFNMAELNLMVLADVAAAETSYHDGISASFATLGAGSASGYYADGGFNDGDYTIVIEDATTDEERLEAIITQKWLAVNGLTAEQSWFDYTRTGYPLNLPLSAQAKVPSRPVRLAYPASETSANPGNLPAQPDVFATPVFWAN